LRDYVWSPLVLAPYRSGTHQPVEPEGAIMADTMLRPLLPLDAEVHDGVPLFRHPGIDLTVQAAEHPAVSDLLEPAAVPRGSAFAEYVDLSHTPITGKVDRRRWQSDFLTSQGARASSWAFAGIAALEAAYARTGVRVKLSEQYLFHIARAWSSQRRGGGVHSLIGSSLSGSSGGGSSFSGSSFSGSSFSGSSGNAEVVHDLAYFAVPEARYVPYVDQRALEDLARVIPQTGNELTSEPGSGTLEQADWFEYDLRHIPLAGCWSASYRVASYGYVATTVDNIKRVLERGHEVVVDVEDLTNHGGHTVLVYGYNDDDGTFLIKNSQSLPGFKTMRYSDDERFRLRAGESYYISAVRDVTPQLAAAWVGRWAIDHDGWRGRLVIRSFVDLLGDGCPPTEDSPIGLGTWYSEDGHHLPVVGWVVDGGRGLVCFIGDQKFELFLHGTDPYFASGRCWWNGTPQGVVLSRGVVTGTGTGPADRAAALGTWETNHDGWRGSLRIGPDSWYRQADDGILRTAWIDPEREPHRVGAHIDFGSDNRNQTFELLVHTQERGVLAGTTTWDSQLWPVSGRLAACLYLIRTDGSLTWYQHTGRDALNFVWEEPRKVGTGWNTFAKVIGGRDGVIYTLGHDGTLQWFLHRGRSQGNFDWSGPFAVGTGWGDFVDIVAGDGGVLYGLKRDGTLHWHRHHGRRDGSIDWDGPVDLGGGWDGFVNIAAGPDGTLYGVRDDGALFWYRHLGFDHGFPVWLGPRKIGTGWAGFDRLLVTGAGYLYGRRGPGGRTAGELWEWRHTGYETGEATWREGAMVGEGWSGRDVLDIFAT
jgi:hypothetical protein